MFVYIGSSLINLDKVKSLEIADKEKICVHYNDSWKYFQTANPRQDLENIFQLIKKNSE
jgi:hypothetical protein